MSRGMAVGKLIETVGLPDGYKRLMWEDATDDQEVWIWGQHDGTPQAHGPHIVTSVRNKRLMNVKRGVSFMQYDECLLVPS